MWHVRCRLSWVKTPRSPSGWIDEHKKTSSSTGKHFRNKHSLAPKDLTNNFTKCEKKIDCPVYEMFLFHKLRPTLTLTQFVLRFLISFYLAFFFVDFIVCLTLVILFILLKCLHIYIHCFNFTIHLVITGVRLKRHFYRWFLLAKFIQFCEDSFLVALRFESLGGEREEVIFSRWHKRCRHELECQDSKKKPCGSFFFFLGDPWTQHTV